MTERRKRPPRRVEVVKSSYQPSKADMKEEIDVSHLEGKDGGRSGSDAHGPGGDGAYATPAPEPVTGAVGTIRYNPRALDEHTCAAEARAPVGSDVVVAKFELLRPVRLLDFDALAEVYDEGSHFDPEYCVRRGRWAFLRQLVREVSMPVMPQDEAFEYLPTQAVAEYLAQKASPPVDGIVFRSTQTG